MKNPEDKMPLTRADMEAILAAGRERVQLLYELKSAILDGDSEREHALAREICGLPKEAARA